MTSINASQTQLSRFGFNIKKYKIHLSYFDIFTSLCCFSDGMWWAVKWKPFSVFSCFSAAVAFWARCFPEAGRAEAGSSRIRVCGRAHVCWKNSGGRVRHRSLTETHDEVCICAQLRSELNPFSVQAVGQRLFLSLRLEKKQETLMKRDSCDSQLT